MVMSIYTQYVDIRVKVAGIRVEHESCDGDDGTRTDFAKLREVDETAYNRALECLKGWLESCPAEVDRVRGGNSSAIRSP